MTSFAFTSPRDTSRVVATTTRSSSNWTPPKPRSHSKSSRSAATAGDPLASRPIARPKTGPRCSPILLIGRRGAVIGRLVAVIGRLDAALGRLGAVKGRRGAVIARRGAVRGRRDAVLARMGAALGRLGAALGRLGAVFGRLGAGPRPTAWGKPLTFAPRSHRQSLRAAIRWRSRTPRRGC